MHTREAFIAAIAAAPADDLPRLVFADWLDENGDPLRASFVRAQIAHTAPGQPHRDLHAHSSAADDAFDAAGISWAHAFLRPLGVEVNDYHISPSCNWSREKPDGSVVRSNGGAVVTLNLNPKADAGRTVGSFTYERGFVSEVHLPPLSSLVRPMLADAFKLEPITTVTTNIDADATAEDWAKLTDPALRRVHTLRARYDPERNWSPLRVLFADPHLAGVRTFALEPDRWFSGTTTPAGVLDQFVGSALAYRLTALHLPGTTREGMRVVCNSSRLRVEELDVSGVEVHRCAALLGHSPTAGTIRRLNLHGCGMDDAAAGQLADGWWPRLAELGLGGNRLTDAGLGELANARFAGWLEVLDLGGNSFTPDGAGLHALAAALNPDRLHRLNLHECGLAEVPACLSERFGERVVV